MKIRLIKYLCLLSVLVLLISACRGQEEFESVVADGVKPKAGFTYVANTMTVTFTNTSQDAESYHWDFGDGTYSIEQSPVHIYALAGYYTPRLKVNSSAGYSDSFEGDPVFVADRLEAAFLSTPELGFSVLFDARSSKNIKSAEWNFGDGATGEGLTVSHAFPAAGEYNVTLKAQGLLDGDIQEITRKVTVFKNTNLLKTSNMGGDAGENWVVMLDGMPVKFGHTDDLPSTSMTPSDGCLRFGGVVVTSGDKQGLVYQGVKVEAGRRYRLSAQIKAPAGGKKSFLQFYVAPSANSADDFIENSSGSANHYLALNTWNGWGSNDTSVAVDGDLYEICQWNGQFGLGAKNGGIYEATETRTVYIGIRTLTQGGIGDILVDDVRFDLQDE